MGDRGRTGRPRRDAAGAARPGARRVQPRRCPAASRDRLPRVRRGPSPPPRGPCPVAARGRAGAPGRRRDREQYRECRFAWPRHHDDVACAGPVHLPRGDRAPGRPLRAGRTPADLRGASDGHAGDVRGPLRAGRLLPAARWHRARAHAQVLGPLLRGAGPDRGDARDLAELPRRDLRADHRADGRARDRRTIGSRTSPALGRDPHPAPRAHPDLHPGVTWAGRRGGGDPAAHPGADPLHGAGPRRGGAGVPGHAEPGCADRDARIDHGPAPPSRSNG